ncbi:MAG: hypothetical protein COY38_01665 [Candidatus Aenigmarchaeota archaeon CG_4_10_14_0_8_um_filter_37_24]|nr:class I SAM-dependent methyltransferase [Candidatus Aenigmarchaeota archaeon]OIN88672.1 MAG: hypothetical protein AUJ50_00160 [Candidatus Aenigmarchaeota archaeon CG1_02_38_14]PIV68066.1 MAG: hypothetical protein COS07_05375 [Candidatus Aenigmarchaeota archaeon CG01_land_8_20_14_3_00_37_9]PIW41274.1 MAG: hypothetical protein COW21_02725 [Candidatus Aenigmarchaeota archaeon CG15_BIG_FIL_POST_REV_8_21_14_020_37_27]PIX50599.1 MAG: hypothetical protein COZ52_03225 [Candidatus Aenigmarchaeota arc
MNAKINQWEKIFKEQGDVFEKPHEYLKFFLKKLKKKNYKRVLDLGCGAGRHLIYLSSSGFDTYGIDLSETGIKICNKKLKEKNLKTNLKLGNIYERLPYPDNFFDAIISVQVLYHSRIKKIRKLIREIERILKPRGLIFITAMKTKRKNGMTKTTKYRKIGERTFMPLDGWEKGLPHFYFNKRLIRKEFSNFKIEKIWLDSTLRYYCFVGELK